MQVIKYNHYTGPIAIKNETNFRYYASPNGTLCDFQSNNISFINRTCKFY